MWGVGTGGGDESRVEGVWLAAVWAWRCLRTRKETLQVRVARTESMLSKFTWWWLTAMIVSPEGEGGERGGERGRRTDGGEERG